MKQGIFKIFWVVLALAGFFLSTWTAHSNTLFQMQHRITHSQKNSDGSYTHILSVALTNLSSVDLSSLKLTASINPETLSVISAQPLNIKRLPATETATLNWSVRSFTAVDKWNQNLSITFTGNARDTEHKPVSLTIVSEIRS